MTQSEHTPGPWEIGYTRMDGYDYCKIMSTNGNWIATAEIRNDKANARLIAAAPELLEALKVARRLIEAFVLAAKHGKVADVSLSAFQDIRIIDERIAKAEATGGVA